MGFLRGFLGFFEGSFEVFYFNSLRGFLGFFWEGFLGFSGWDFLWGGVPGVAQGLAGAAPLPVLPRLRVRLRPRSASPAVTEPVRERDRRVMAEAAM